MSYQLKEKVNPFGITMDFNQLITSRYSCRKFSDKPVSHTDLIAIAEAGRIAPSACNLQTYHFYIVGEDKFKDLLGLRDWYGAKNFILACVTNESGWVRSNDRLNYRLIDIGIAVDHMMLQATALGLQTCIVGSYDPYQIARHLNVSEHHHPTIGLLVGYALDDEEINGQHFVRKSYNDLFTVCK